MKIVEIMKGIHIPLNNEEVDLLGRFDESTSIMKNEFSERERIIANQLVNKDVLLRHNHGGRMQYKKKI